MGIPEEKSALIEYKQRNNEGKFTWTEKSTVFRLKGLTIYQKKEIRWSHNLIESGKNFISRINKEF